MSNYIEFTTAHRERTYGNPVHDGKKPKRYHDITGVRVDGDEVNFLDDSIVERLQRYFVESKKLRQRRIANDCVAFVALMNSIELEGKRHNPFSRFDDTTFVDSATVDTTDNSPLVLAQGFGGEVIIPRHVILPAHLIDGQNYLHKLGDNGPICMSDLTDSLKIMGCTNAHPVQHSV